MTSSPSKRQESSPSKKLAEYLKGEAKAAAERERKECGDRAPQRDASERSPTVPTRAKS